jgi:hypothetical protein
LLLQSRKTFELVYTFPRSVSVVSLYVDGSLVCDGPPRIGLGTAQTVVRLLYRFQLPTQVILVRFALGNVSLLAIALFSSSSSKKNHQPTKDWPYLLPAMSTSFNTLLHLAWGGCIYKGC